MGIGREAALLQLHLPEGWPESGTLTRFRYAVLRGVTRETGIAALAELPPADVVVAVAPASAVTLVRVELPQVRGARLTQLLPMAVEDLVASPPEDVHAVIVEHLHDAPSLVAVVGKAWLSAALEALDAAGIRPSRMIAESELAALRAAAERTAPWLVVRTPAGGFVVSRNAALTSLDVPTEPGRLPFALRRLRDDCAAQGTLPDEVVVFGGEGVPEPDLRVWGRVLQLPIRNGGIWRPEDLDARRAATTDLLRGGFKSVGGPGAIPRGLKAAAIAACVLLAAHAALTVVDWARISFEANAIDSRMESEFRRLFPDTTAVVDAPLQLQRRLAEMRRSAGIGDSSDLIPLLGAISPPLGELGAQAERIRYERGELELEVLLPGDEARPALEKRLAVPGYRVRIEKLAREAGGQVAVLRVTAGGLNMGALRQWLDGLAPRDRNVLIAGSGALIVLLLYAFVWDPLRMDHARLRESIPGLRAQAARFDALAGEAERLRGSARAVTGPSGPAAIEAAADRTGVRGSIKSIEQQSGAKVQVAVESVSYDALLAWIADVASTAGMSVDSIQVQRGAAPGMVSVPSLVFKGRGGA